MKSGLAVLLLAAVAAACGNDASPARPGSPRVCAEGNVLLETCGKNDNGFRALKCANNVYQPVQETCYDPDTCVNKEILETVCGLNNRGTRIAECIAGQYQDIGCIDRDGCIDGVVEVLSCGTEGKGTQYRSCGDGQWTPPTLCLEQRACSPGTRIPRNESCGTNNAGQTYLECVDNLLIVRCLDDDVCENNTIKETPCGEMGRGKSIQQCNDGQWSVPGECLPNAPGCGYLLLERQSIPADAEQYTLQEQFLLINDDGIPAEQRDVAARITVQYVPPIVPFHLASVRAYLGRATPGAFTIDVQDAAGETVASFSYQNSILTEQPTWTDFPIAARVEGTFSLTLSAPTGIAQLGTSRGEQLPAFHPRYRSASCLRTSIGESARTLTDRDALLRVIGYGMMDCTREAEGNRCMPR